MATAARQMHVVDIESIPVIYHHEGREQIRRIVTRGRDGYQKFSFHVVHFDANLEKDMKEGDLEIVLFVLQGSAKLTWDDKTVEVRPGSAICVAPLTPYHHTTGPQGMTVAVCVSPPIE